METHPGSAPIPPDGARLGPFVPLTAELGEGAGSPVRFRVRTATHPRPSHEVPGHHGRARPLDGERPSGSHPQMVTEARKNGMLSAEEAANLTDVPNVRQKGARLGNWYCWPPPIDQRSRGSGTTRSWPCWSAARCGEGIGLAHRRGHTNEENRWVIADLRGKGGRVRTVAVPLSVKQGINAWQTAANRRGSAAPVCFQGRQSG